MFKEIERFKQYVITSVDNNMRYNSINPGLDMITEIETNLFAIDTKDRTIYINRVLYHLFNSRMYLFDIGITLIEVYSNLEAHHRRELKENSLISETEREEVINEMVALDFTYLTSLIRVLGDLVTLIEEFEITFDTRKYPIDKITGICLTDITGSFNVKRSTMNNNFTAPRQVLAIQYILEELGVKTNDNKTKSASFMQFLTGRQPDLAAKDTSLYGYQNPNNRSKKAYNKDCEYVAGKFKEIGLGIIAKKIENGKEE